MIDDSGRELEQPRPLELVDQLSEAKSAIPAPRAGFVSRARIIEAARSQHHKVVGVTAPAGYRESTMLAEWAASEDRRVAWVSLDRFDDDPQPSSRRSQISPALCWWWQAAQNNLT